MSIPESGFDRLAANDPSFAGPAVEETTVLPAAPAYAAAEPARRSRGWRRSRTASAPSWWGGASAQPAGIAAPAGVAQPVGGAFAAPGSDDVTAVVPAAGFSSPGYVPEPPDLRREDRRRAAAAGVVSAPATLDARTISAWFGERRVLDRVSLTMPSGIITSLIGPSGCGKSTFLRILNRMHELIPGASLAGEVVIDGADIYDPSRRVVDARKEIGMVFQKPNPFPAMSIYDNVVAGLKLTGLRADRDRKDYLVETSLQRAGLWNEVKDRLRQPGGGLSGGQQQRLCIARSLAITPRVLLMDEPCSALDPTSTRVIEETMLELAHDVTIVIVTHNMQQAQRVSQQCAFFLAAQGTPGVIVEHGSTEAMFESPIDSRTYDYVNGRFG
jgi:phosphate transport system ATP-binding protein